MRVKLINNKINVSFGYDHQLVSWVKTLDGRIYMPESRSWSIPLTTSPETLKRLQDKGFLVDREVIDHILNADRLAKEAENLVSLKDTKFDTTLINVVLYPFQRVCSAFMIKIGSCLNACGVGTGKTLMTLSVIAKNQTKRNLVIVPKSLMYQWGNECHRVLPDYKVFVVIGNLKQRKEVYEKVAKCLDPYFLILSYEVARIDVELIRII